VGTLPKIAVLKQLQTHFKSKCKKVWERRSHAFPTHYTPGFRFTIFVIKSRRLSAN